jgi:hypothetical protein
LQEARNTRQPFVRKTRVRCHVWGYTKPCHE